MLPPELEVIKDIPCYRLILQTVIKYQIKQLLQQLSEHTKEESIILSASSDGAVTYQGTSLGETFLQKHKYVKSMFVNFCSRNHPEKARSNCETSSVESTTVQATQMPTAVSLLSTGQQEPESPQSYKAKFVSPRNTEERPQPSVTQGNVLANSSVTTPTGITFPNTQAILESSNLLPTSRSVSSQQSVNVLQNPQTVTTHNVTKSTSAAMKYVLLSNTTLPQNPGSRTVNIVRFLDGNKKSSKLAENRYHPYPQPRLQCPAARQPYPQPRLQYPAARKPIPIFYLPDLNNKQCKLKEPVLSDTQSLSNIKIVSVQSCASEVVSETPNSDSFSPSSSNQCDNLFENADTQDRKDNITPLNTVASLRSVKENSWCSEENETSMNSLVVTKHEDTMDCENVTVVAASSEVQVKVEEDSTCPSGILNSASSAPNSCNQSVNSFEDPHTEDKTPNVHEDSVNGFVVTRCDDSDDDNMDCENDKLDDTGNAVDSLVGESGSTSRSADGATTEAALEKEEVDHSSELRNPDTLSETKDQAKSTMTEPTMDTISDSFEQTNSTQTDAEQEDDDEDIDVDDEEYCPDSDKSEDSDVSDDEAVGNKHFGDGVTSNSCLDEADPSRHVKGSGQSSAYDAIQVMGDPESDYDDDRYSYFVPPSGSDEENTSPGYAARSKDLSDVGKSVTSDLTKMEEYLMKSQELLTVQGKGGQPVPVIIPADVKQALEFIASREARAASGISDDNKYLFPNTELKYTRAYDSLKAACDNCRLKSPQRISSVAIRKYIATLSQLMTVDKCQMDWLCRHMGHAEPVHTEAYSQMCVLRVYVTKLMMVQDLNLTWQLTGRSLEDIDLNDIVYALEETTEKPTEPRTVNKKVAFGERYIINGTRDVLDGGVSEGESSLKKWRKKRTTRKRWTDLEVKELKTYFREYLDKGIAPRGAACDTAKKKSSANNGMIWKRANHLIIKKISNMNHSKK